MSTFDITKDPRFKQGRKFIKDKNYEDSIDIFESLLRTCNEKYGEMSLETAQAWYEYGNVLLLKEEENPTNDLLGNVQQDPNRPNEVPEDEDVGEEDEPDNGAEEEGGEDGGDFEDEDEPEGDLQIAWEALDVARTILIKEDNAPRNILLSDIYMRLGDLNKFNSNTIDAIQEYQNALAIRNLICQPHEGALSDAHFSLAVAYVYNSSEKDTGVVDPIDEKKKALVHYKKAHESIVKWMEVHKDAKVITDASYRAAPAAPTTSSSSTSSGSSFSSSSTSVSAFSSSDEAAEVAAVLADKSELADMLKETIDALSAEIEEELKGGASSSSSTGGAGVTTIGFGNPSGSSSSSSSSSSAFASSSASGFSAPSTSGACSAPAAGSSSAFGVSSSSAFGVASSSSAGAAVAEVNTLQVKRKKRPLEEAEASAPATK